MNRIALSLSILLAAVSSAVCAQTYAPSIGYVYPAGGQAGSSIQVIVGGMNFRRVDGVMVSGGGVRIESVRLFRPFERFNNDLRRELAPILRAIDEGRDPLAASKKSSEKLLDRLKKQQEREGADGDSTSLKRQLEIVPGERLIYIDMTPEEVVKKIHAMAPLEYECLCKAVFTKRNVLQASPAIDQTLIVGVSIAADAEPGTRELRVKGRTGVSNPLAFVVGTLPEKLEAVFRTDRKNPPRLVELPILMSGRIMPGEVDRIRFPAGAGTQYSFSVMGRALVPFLGDAVPGWFQPIISVHSLDGKMLAFADDNLFHPDPVLCFSAPAKGEYELQIRDSIFRGREDFVYRITAQEGALPKAVQKPLKMKHELKTIREHEPNNARSAAQAVQFPGLIAGTVGRPGDVDTYSFRGGKGQEIVAEVFARRLDSPVDSKVYLLDSAGKVLAWNDDWKWPNIGIKTHHADSYLTYELPADGTYFVQVAETQHKGGEGFNYKLRVDRPRPDFQIYMNPSALNIRAGTCIPITMNLCRQDGFVGAVDVRLEDAPAGVALAGSRIPAGVHKITMTLFVPRRTKPGVYGLELGGRANVAGREVCSRVIPAEDVMQAFLWRHVVPTEKAVLAVIGRGWVPFKAAAQDITLTPGEQFELPLKQFGDKVRKEHSLVLELDSPPKGVSVAKTETRGRDLIMTLAVAPDTEPWSGNLIVKCIGERENPRNEKKHRFLMGCLPAVPTRIVRR